MQAKIKGESSKDMKNINRLIVLKLISTLGEIKRSEIIEYTNLSKMTATNIAEDLMVRGIITEAENKISLSGAGRRPSLLRLSENSPLVGGIYIGRKSCSVLFSDLSAKVICENKKEYEKVYDAESLIDFVSDLYSETLKGTKRKVLCTGLSVPGPVDSLKGIILAPTNFFGIKDLPIKDILEEKFNSPVTLAHDTACAAEGEHLYGAGKNMDNFLLVHLHHGIGAGIIANGKVFDGAMGIGGELGHISIDLNGEKCECGARGCLEKYANEQNLLKDYNSISKTQARSISLKEVTEKAAKGDKAAIYAAEKFTSYLSAALVSALNFIDTHKVILSYHGVNGILEKMLEKEINSSIFASRYRKIEVIPSAFKGDATIIGAVAAAAEEIFSGKVKITEEW
ncbi:MAG: ROK family protein [Ruminococcaceae bacterium]|nr:ROK family protein [Oscillospiraceae bacterium]